MAKKFFYVCAGLFLLALSFHLGATSASAQFGASGFGFVEDGFNFWVMTPNGDVYHRTLGDADAFSSAPATLIGNFWASGPVPALHQSWGQLKSRYAPNGGTVSKGADTR